MAGRQAAHTRIGVSNGIEDWMTRRNADVQRLKQEAEAAGREAWERATRAGENLAAMRPEDVVALGAKLLKRGGPAFPQAARKAPVQGARPRSSTPVREGVRLLDYTGKVVAGMAARPVGAVAGAARGLAHTGRDIVEGVNFVSRLMDPQDARYSPPGEAAWDQVVSAGDRAFKYVKHGASNPAAVVDDVDHALHVLRLNISPSATPMADTMSGEFKRNYEIGKNQGELAFDIGATFYGGAMLKGVLTASKATRVAKGVKQGLTPAQAAYLAKDYVGRGHHVIPQRFRFPKTVLNAPLPRAIAGQPLPKSISESAFNVLKPSNISQGAFYELHNGVDKSFHGARIGAKGGGGSWSAKRLGLPKYGTAKRLWYGAPGPLKAVIGGAATEAAAEAYDHFDEERSQ